MASRKSPTTLLKEANAEIEKLKNTIKSLELSKDTMYQNWQKAQQEINSIHAALDTLPGIQGKRVKISEYENVDLTITARLFSWISCMAFGGKKINIAEQGE
jgi:chromosome segregation ATPase